MKKYLSVFVFILSFSITKGQDKGYIGISVGPNIALGDFKSIDENSSTSGFAKTGLIFDLSLSYKIGKSAGLGVILRGQANSTDAQAIADGLARAEPGIAWTVEAKSWATGGIFAGYSGSYLISEGASFELKAMLGYVSSSCPEFNITGDQAGSIIIIKQSSVDASSFAFLIGGGFQFNLGSRICLLTQLDYMTAEPHFKNVEVSSNRGNYEKFNFKQSIESVSLSAGLGLRL